MAASRLGDRPRRPRRRLRSERHRARRPRSAAGRDAGARSRRSGRGRDRSDGRGGPQADRRRSRRCLLRPRRTLRRRLDRRGLGARISSPRALEKTKAAWSEAGRDGEPRTKALAYFSLGDRAEEEARAYLTDYYAWLGEEIAEFLVAGAAKDPETVKQYVATYEAAGCDELILCPSSGDPGPGRPARRRRRPLSRGVMLVGDGR